MAKAGQEVHNPRQKERIVFRQTSRETGGRLLRLEMFASPGGAPPPEHLHPRQEERFETISGVLRARVGGEDRVLRAGESMVVPANTAHTWWVDGEEGTRVLVEFRPALNTEAFFETMYGLARDGKLDENGAPSLLQTAIISSAYEIYLSRPPVALQKALYALLAPVGEMMGYRASYPEYSGADATKRDGSDGDGRGSWPRSAPASSPSRCCVGGRHGGSRHARSRLPDRPGATAEIAVDSLPERVFLWRHPPSAAAP
jgi:quercetin dioxygenase-like cupin family protein